MRCEGLLMALILVLFCRQCFVRSCLSSMFCISIFASINQRQEFVTVDVSNRYLSEP